MYDVGDTAQLKLTVDPHDGSTVATVAATSPSGLTSAPVAVSDDGGQTWTANLPLTEQGRWPVLWTVTGKGANVERDSVFAFAPTVGRTYATLSDLASYLHAEPGPTADRDLVTATRLVDALLIGAVYPVTDVDGLPILTAHVHALRDAVCAQAAWFDETGDSTGAGEQYQSTSIGALSFTRGYTGGGSAAGASQRYAPDTILILRTAGLLPINAAVYG